MNDNSTSRIEVVDSDAIERFITALENTYNYRGVEVPAPMCSEATAGEIREMFMEIKS